MFNERVWKELGRAALADIVIPTVVKVGTELAKAYAANLTRDNKIVMRLSIQGEDASD